jgi:N-acyl-D-amino-acid deacylase
MATTGNSSSRCDVIIEGGEIVDGTGAERMRADVAIADDRIVAVGDLAGMDGAERVDATGLVVTPGFIDAHTHDDRLVLSSPDMTPKVSQGVTTVITGNCGLSLAPFAGREPPPPMNLLGGRDWFRFETMGAYAAQVEKAPPAINLAPLVGHTTLRAAIMDTLDRPAKDREVVRMGALLEEALDAGCIGMSTGLAYPPAHAAPTDEVVALAEHLAPRGAIYTTHMRNEGAQVLESVEETLEIGRRAGVPVVISHHKCSGRENWGLSHKTLAAIGVARRQQTVNLDVYPYTASSTVLGARWIRGAERTQVTWSTPHPECAGRDFEDIRAEWGCSLEEAAERLQPAGGIYHQMHEDDVRRILAFEDAMVGSDGLPHDEFPHPRLWGTFPRVLGHYSRELGLFPLEEAVRRMSGVTAGVFGLTDRGVIRENAYADVVLLDPGKVLDAATFEQPRQCAHGIHRVWVNGRAVWQSGASTGARPGRLLRHNASRRMTSSSTTSST